MQMAVCVKECVDIGERLYDIPNIKYPMGNVHTANSAGTNLCSGARRPRFLMSGTKYSSK
jgi:hypothetical protein